MKYAGCEINLGDIIFEPPRDGPTLWETKAQKARTYPNGIIVAPSNFR